MVGIGVDNMLCFRASKPVAGLRGGLRGHGPTLLLDLCWSHANICTYMYARIYSVECIYTEILML